MSWEKNLRFETKLFDRLYRIGIFILKVNSVCSLKQLMYQAQNNKEHDFLNHKRRL